MKKLQKLQLKNVTAMSAPQMKHITGGYDGDGKCGGGPVYDCWCGGNPSEWKGTACSSEGCVCVCYPNSCS
jgi:natural product precursor